LKIGIKNNISQSRFALVGSMGVKKVILIGHGSTSLVGVSN
jgi:hypothetical protein